MTKIDTNQLLAQLRTVAHQAQGTSAKPLAPPGASFSSLLRDSLGKVNELQQTSATQKKAFELGDPSVDLPDVMISGAKASLAFQAALQIRNKLVEAYQEISRMPV